MVVGKTNIENMKPVKKQKKSITGSTLKIIAIVTMMIDHIGATIFEKMLINNGMFEAINSNNVDMINQFMMDNGTLYMIWLISRMVIGRIAFPIFCFLLVEGFTHTSDIKKYVMRLGIFALLSEIPFDLAFKGQFLEFTYQNIFFTLFIGLLVMVSFKYIEERAEWNKGIKFSLSLGALILGMFTADFLKTDYAAIGIICIMVIFLFRKNKLHQIIAGCVAFIWEITAPIAFIPIGFYKGERGLNVKYLFYIFYPAHLLVLYLIAKLMGIA